MTDKMRCEQVDELAASYALYAASPEEIAALESHLSGCDKHAAVVDLLATAHRLAALPDEMDPPPELKTRLMAAVHADLAAERTGAAAPAQAGAPSRGWLSRLFGSPRGGFVLAGAVAAVVAVLIVTNPFSGGEGGDDALVRSFEVDGITGELSFVPGEDSASMKVEGMDPAPDGQVYQVWAITDGAPESIGFLEIEEDGATTTDMDAELSRGQTVAITVEPEGGSALPTTEPVLSVDI